MATALSFCLYLAVGLVVLSSEPCEVLNGAAHKETHDAGNWFWTRIVEILVYVTGVLSATICATVKLNIQMEYI